MTGRFGITKKRDARMTNKPSIVSTEEVNKIVEELADLERVDKRLKKRREELKHQLHNYMTENEILINYETGEEFVSWAYSKPRKTFDTKKLEFELPDIYKKYCTIGDPVRTLRIIK